MTDTGKREVATLGGGCYYRRNPRQGYCQVVIAPKVAKFRKQFADRLRERPASA